MRKKQAFGLAFFVILTVLSTNAAHFPIRIFSTKIKKSKRLRA